MIDVLLVLVVVLAVVVLVSAPLRARGDGVDPEAADRAELADLEAAKEAKYREIRDAELDLQTGKLSQQDFSTLDAELRSEAIALLRRIDDVRARIGAGAGTADATA